MKYHLDQIDIDAEKREIWVNQNQVQVRPQVFDLLVLLAASRGRVISREDLFNKLWPNQAVSDGVLSTCIREARQALGDNGHEQRLIKTIHGHGFRFLPEVQIESHPKSMVSDQTQATPPILAQPQTTQSVSPTPVVDEQRQVTLLCCRVGNKADTFCHDAQALHRRDKKRKTTLHQTVTRYGGQLLDGNQPNGPEALAIFGLSQTREDDTLRAVLAATTLQAQSTHPIPMGIDTGRILAGFCEDSQAWHVTQIDGIEQRARILLDLEDNPSIWLTDKAWQQVRDQVETDPQPFHNQTIYRIRSLKPHLQQPMVRCERLRTRFVGRKRELETLLALVDQARTGQGQLVGIVGEAGIGKTRLLHELQSQVEQQAVNWVTAYCRSYGMDRPFGLIIDLIRALCGISIDDSPKAAKSKAHRLCERCGIDETSVGTTMHLLGLEVSTETHIHQDLQSYCQQVASELKRLVTESFPTTSIIAIEDLHCIDSSSESSLQALVSTVASTSTIMLLTYRPGYQPLFLKHSFATQIAINPISEGPSMDIVTDLVSFHDLTVDLKHNIVDRAQGNPLFLQELTLQAIQTGHRSDQLLEQPVPRKIQAVIRARIDRLPTRAKTVLQIAAVIGKEFEVDLLQRLVEPQQYDLQEDLNRLLDDEFLTQTSWQPLRYAFRHGLIQSAAYQCLLNQDRKKWHRDVATHLQQIHPLLKQQHPEELAIHYQRCEAWSVADKLWLHSAKLALERHAGVEALALLTHGLDCIFAQEQNLERDKKELEAQTLRLTAVQLTKGFGSYEVEKTQQRLFELTDRLGCARYDPPAIFLRYCRCEFSTAQRMARRLEQKAISEREPVLHIAALELQGIILSHMGRFFESNQHLNRTIELYEPSYHNPAAPHDPGVSAYCILALNNMVLGYVDQARAFAKKGTQLANELNHLPTLAMAKYLRSLALADMGLFDLAVRLSQQAIDLAEKAQLVLWSSAARIVNGWARVHLGETKAGLAQAEQAFQDWSKTHARIAVPLFRAVLAELCLVANQSERASEHISKGLEYNNQDNQRLREPELLRLQANALLATGAKTDEVDHWLLRAETSARALHAKLFELRTVTSRAQLWRGTAREEEMLGNLRDIFSWFSEGFDLPDIIEAKRLLRDDFKVKSNN